MKQHRQTVVLATVVISGSLLIPGCGVIGADCSGLGAIVCGLGLYCRYEPGECGEDGAVGVCAPRPEACTLIFAPVCGCDGETYGNECEAAPAGTSVRSDGPCPDDEQICGGLAGFACDEGEFCQFPEGACGAADETGVCKDVPDVCPELYAPVCGCDDQTYGNQCEAERAGVSIVHDGECDDIEARICGGISGEPCLEGEFCRLPEGQCCCDIQGFCEVIPEVCTLEFDPVCGCDNVTYGNECEAARAGVSVQSQGECP